MQKVCAVTQIRLGEWVGEGGREQICICVGLEVTPDEKSGFSVWALRFGISP